MAEKKNVYVSLHEAFVREGIQYTDRRTGEQRSFNVVRLPPHRHRRQGRRRLRVQPALREPFEVPRGALEDVPLLADREVRLSRSVLDAEGRPILGEDGRRQKTVTVTPSQIRDALSGGEEALRGGERTHATEGGLAERAAGGEGSSESMERGRRAPFRP